MRGTLRELLGRLEVDFDYPEEREDAVASGDAVLSLQEIQKEIKPLIASWDRGKRLGGFRLAIIGQPNVGKSSLLNASLEEDRAIVTSTPGTTRDVVSGMLNFNGVPAELLDTAGIRTISKKLDTPEAEGIRRSWREVERAHLVLIVFDTAIIVTDDDIELVKRAREITKGTDTSILLVANKSDLFSAWDSSVAGMLVGAPDLPCVIVSAVTGEGIEKLRSKVAEILDLGSTPDEITLTELRHMSLFRKLTR